MKILTKIIEVVKMAFTISFVVFYAFIGQFIPWIALIYYGCELSNNSTVVWNQFLGYGLIGLALPVAIICHVFPFVLFADKDCGWK